MKHKNDLKIAIIGAGPTGLACALECERLGVIADVFEKSYNVGWIWPGIVVFVNVFERGMGDVRENFRREYHLDLKPSGVCRSLILKSPNAKAEINSHLGYFYYRGKHPDSIENQLIRTLKRTPIHFNRPADYKELAKSYDYVVVATGKDTAAKELGVWEDMGRVHIRGGLAMGDYPPNATTFFYDTRYAGHGYAKLTPITTTELELALYCIGHDEMEVDSLFNEFIVREGLEHLEFTMKYSLPVFSTGKVSKFQIDNVLLAGRAAGLTERLMGAGGVAAIISGIMAARAIINGKDYETLMKPLKNHIENISVLRQPLEKLDNKGLDRLITTMGTPGIKHVFYDTDINFIDMAGEVLKGIYK
ncbi:dehydrogenase [Desulfotomaculum sp. 1211_IL3151]|uniref:dehydrogenase n=1 Tax=Desulfotomaculum sp. 1211_IL3151 TaxID=3084055 RepID=UPI002FD87EAD